jgi:hypothetical protein
MLDIHFIDQEMLFRRESCGTDGYYHCTLDAVIARDGDGYRLVQAVEFSFVVNGDVFHVPSHLHRAWFGYLMAGGLEQIEKHIKAKHAA